MPTTFTDQFWLIDAFNPPPAGTTLTVSSFDVVDQNDNNLINRFSGDSVDGVDITASYPGDTITVTITGLGNVTFVGTTFYLADGRVVFTPTDGQILQTGTLVSTTFATAQGSTDTTDFGPPCFVGGTRIETPQGPRPVEDLEDGDKVVSYTGEILTIRKVLTRQICARELAINPKLRPVRIVAGALGGGLPKRDLLVSRQHRMLVQSKVCDRMFAELEVLVAAIRMTEFSGIFEEENMNGLTYFHLLFDAHEVIIAEGAPTESLYTGPEALKSVDPDAREEILTLFPEVLELGYTPKPARLIPTGAQQKRLVARHCKNGKPPLVFG